VHDRLILLLSETTYYLQPNPVLTACARELDEVEWQGGRVYLHLGAGRDDPGLRASDHDRDGQVSERGKNAAPTPAVGNLCGDLGATTKPYRTALGEMSPGHEQLRWSLPGPVGLLGTDS
jgi:hypothetical protein